MGCTPWPLWSPDPAEGGALNDEIAGCGDRRLLGPSNSETAGRDDSLVLGPLSPEAAGRGGC